MARFAGIDAGEALDPEREMLVGVGPIHYPPAFAGRSTRGAAPATMELGQVSIFEPDEMELALAGERRAGAIAVTDLESLGKGCEDGGKEQQNCRPDRQATKSDGRSYMFHALGPSL